jgi:hypothetical protein
LPVSRGTVSSTTTSGVGVMGSATGGGGATALGAALFLDPDLLVERAAQLMGRPLELAKALAQGPPQLRQFSGPEDDERERQDDDELGHPDGTNHKKPLEC